MSIAPETLSSLLSTWLFASFGLVVIVEIWFHNFLQSVGAFKDKATPRMSNLIGIEMGYHEWRKEKKIPHTLGYKMRITVLFSFFSAVAADYLLGT